MCRIKIFKYLNDKYRLIDILPEDKKEMLEYRRLIYQKYCSRFDRFLSFIFDTDVFRLVWEFPNGKRYCEYEYTDK